jgi:hypothetical protein
VSSTAAPWQWLLTLEILQLLALRSSCHIHPCRTQVNCHQNYSALLLSLTALSILNSLSRLLFQLSLSLSLMLRPTDSRPVCLGIKHSSGAYDQIFISVRNTEYVWQLRSWFRGTPSLMRGRVCLLHVPLALARAVFLGS